MKSERPPKTQLPEQLPPAESCFAWWVWNEPGQEWHRLNGIGGMDTVEESTECPPVFRIHTEAPALMQEVTTYKLVGGSEPPIEWNTEKSMNDAAEVCRLMANELEDGLKMAEGNGLVIDQSTKDDIHRQLSTLYRAGLILRKRSDALKCKGTGLKKPIES